MTTDRASRVLTVRTLQLKTSRRLKGTAVALAAALVVVGCGGGGGARVALGAQREVVSAATGGAAARAPKLTVVPSLSVSASSQTSGASAMRSRALPANWDVSFDVHLTRGSRLVVSAGSGQGARTVLAFAGAAPKLSIGGRTYARTRRPGWRGGGWVHVDATRTSVAVDGRSFAVALGTGGPLAFRAVRGRATVRALIISAASDRPALLLHRLAELHARVPAGDFPLGATRKDNVEYANRYWTNGFYAGALWQAAKLAPAGGMFANWALAATIDHFGEESKPTHDVGFMYGESSLAAWQALCRGPVAPRGGSAGAPHAGAALCARLKNSVLSAADELLALEATNARAGTIPTTPTSGDTIIDSMMNIAILPWASRVTGNPVYSQVASHHAQVVASLLVRPDGSTAQSVKFDPATGQVLYISTHQGLSDTSTWARGQGWAVYGFSQAAVQLHDVSLLRVALRAAGYVADHLPASGIPLWDYDAPADAPVDVSAGVITAAGMFHLADACRALPGTCSSPGQWDTLGRRMLNASLTRAATQPPLGLLTGQALNERSPGHWFNGGELIFGLTYALEADNLMRG